MSDSAADGEQLTEEDRRVPSDENRPRIDRNLPLVIAVERALIEEFGNDSVFALAVGSDSPDVG